MRKALSLILTAAMLLTSCLALASCNGAEGKYVIGICQQAPHEALDDATRGFMDALKQELGEGNVEFLLQNANGDTTICTTISNNFANKRVDLMLGNGTTALQACANASETIPVLGTSITAYEAALSLEEFNGLVGYNVSGTSDIAPLEQQAAMITTFFSGAEKIGLLYCSAEPNSDYQIEKVKEYLEQAGRTCIEFPFTDSNDVTTVAAAAAAASDVIYVPTDNTVASCSEAINNVVLPTKTPIVGGDAGICGGCGVIALCVDYYELGIATGKMAAAILKGEEEVSQMKIRLPEHCNKVYNASHCAELGIDITALEAAGYTALENQSAS
ncbi:MAG: ABC transporter substrate-binding protein [Clostridia bacterium]|nr:ABC transporter substrate-binding protein [Clostridia bacterium]